MATSCATVLALLLLSLSSGFGAKEYSKDFLSDEEFQQWVSRHYDGRIDLEEVYPTWRRNADFVKQHNSLESSYSLSVNKFAHLENMNGYLSSAQMAVSSATNKNADSSNNRCQESPRFPTASESVDWREKGVVPPVTNQGQINSAITYAVVDSIDALWAIEKNHYKLVLGSYEEYQDCCVTNKAFWNSSCFTCVTQLGGLASLAEYHSPNHTCRSDAFKPVVTVNDGALVQPTGDEKALAEQVAVQPVAAFVNAALSSFQLYSGGIYDDPKCSSSQLDHVVLVVGYGSRDGNDYWIVKNSWGEDWGEKGYILIARNGKNVCGIASQAMYPVLFC